MVNDNLTHPYSTPEYSQDPYPGPLGRPPERSSAHIPAARRRPTTSHPTHAPSTSFIIMSVQSTTACSIFSEKPTARPSALGTGVTSRSKGPGTLRGTSTATAATSISVVWSTKPAWVGTRSQQLATPT